MTTIELEPVDFYCPECDSIMDETRCNAPRCNGYRCVNCGAGCDVGTPEGRCGRALRALASIRRRQEWEWLAGRKDWQDWPFRGGECL